MNAFDYNTIDEYQIEITTRCNAACPQCPRNNLGSGINPYMQLLNLPRAVIDRAFNPTLCARLRQVFFCGSYGDPIVHPEFLDILQDFRSKNPTLWLYVHTNGGVHNTDYWSRMADIMAGYGQVDFGIDGLSDTLSVYRRNVKYHKVIENAQAFIDAGGRALWQMVVFAHNEHQVDTAEQTAMDMGFHKFLPRKTGRFFHHHDEIEMDRWPVLDKSGNVEYYLEPPSNTKWRNQSMINMPKIKQEHGTMENYFNQTNIECNALMGRKVAVNAQGMILPCNFFNHNLYDARFYNQTLPGANQLHNHDGGNQVRTFIESYGVDALNIHRRSIEQIFQSKFWTDLVTSWNKQFNNGRIFECAMTCGQKFTKVWDQIK